MNCIKLKIKVDMNSSISASNMWRNKEYVRQDCDSPFQTENTEVFSPFEVKTLPLAATFKVQDKVSVFCISSPLYVVVGFDHHVTIFKEDSFEVIWQIQAGNPCSISLSDDSCLLLVAEKSGLLQLYHIPTKVSLWSHVFEKESVPLSISETHISIDNSGFLKINVFTKENVTFELSNISISFLYSAIDEGSFSEVFDEFLIEEADMSILFPNYRVENNFQMFHNTHSIGLVTQDSGSLTSNSDLFCIEDIIDGDMEADWDYKTHQKSMFQCYDLSLHGRIIKACNTRDGRYIVFLNDKHVLSVMCSFTHNILKTWAHSECGSCIKSFVINETIDPSSFLVVERKIGLLIETSMSPTGPKCHSFEIRKFPSFQLIHTLSLSDFVQLVECKPNQDFWYILDGEFDENSGDTSSHLHLKAIVESLPEARLMNLVNRRKFLEAEKFAEKSNLDIEVIHKTKINCFLNNLSVNKYKNLPESDQDVMWSELDDSFKHIKDVQFIKACILFPLPEKSYMERLFLCLKNWVIQNREGNDTEDIISKVNQSLNLLSTHEILCNELDSCVLLKDFLSKNLLNYMISELKAGNLNTSFIIWRRHKVELLGFMSSETVNQIINSIPDGMPSQHLVLFLCDEFLPSLFSRNPDTIDVFAEWLISRVYLVELYEKESWPENGQKLVSAFLKVIHDLQEKDKTGEISLTTSLSFAEIHKKFVKTEFAVGCLSELSRDLALLVSLNSKFNCKLSLADCQESKMNVIFSVLDRVDLELLPNAVEEFARPYALENELDLEYCLEHYVKHTLQSSYFTWWSWDEDPWEERLIAVTEAIDCSEKWMNAALLVASHAAVPWSQEMKLLVEKGMACDHPRKTEFQIEYKLVGLKEVLIKYDKKSFQINNDARLIYVLVNYILKQNKDSALEDAKKVLTSVHDQEVEFDVHYKCLLYASNHKKLSEMSGILSGLPQDTAIKCAKRLLQYFKLQLNDSFFFKYQKVSSNNLLHAALYLIEYLYTAKNPIDEDLVTPIRHLLKLQDEYSICLTLDEITSRSHCRMLIDSAITDFLEKRVLRKIADTSLRKHKPVTSSISELQRLGDILLFEREEVMGLLITVCLQKKKYDLVLELCKDLTISFPSEHIAETLMKVVKHFYLNFKTISDTNFTIMVDTICYMTNVAVTYCKEDSIVNYLEVVSLSTYISTLKEICGQSSLPISPEYTSDSYHKWKFSPRYQDEGFQLNCDMMTNFIVELSLNIIRESDSTSLEIYNNQHLWNCTKEIINHMTERGQGIAALRTIFLYYSVNSKTSADDSTMTLPVVDKVTFSVIQRALSPRKVDFHFILNMFTILQDNSKMVALETLLKWCSTDFHRLTVVGQIGMELTSFLQNTEVFTMYENIFKKASLLSKQNVKATPPLSVISNSSNPSANWAIVKDLILSKNVGLPFIYECCSAFQLKTDHVLVQYVNNILTESETFLHSEDFEKKIVPALKKAECAIGYITDEQLLYNNFVHLLKKVSPYSYEVLLFIKEQLHMISANIQTVNNSSAEKDIQILKFLQVYKRISPLDKHEINVWKSLQLTDMKLPDIAKNRLPFHYLLQENLSNIINPELNTHTLPVWLKIASVLNMSENDLVVVAVKNKVVSYLSQHSAPHIKLYPDMRFISVIDDMIEKISLPETSACCAAWVINQMPPGGNKVAFADITVKFAKRWYEQCAATENVVSFYNKFESIKRQSAIERVLYKNNLTSDAVLSLLRFPTKLIEYLIETYSLNIHQCIKVCRAASEIEMITEVGTNRIFLNYIIKWSNITRSTVANMDETFSEDTSISNELGDTDGENILRIINLLLSLPESCIPNIYNSLKMHFKDIPSGQKAQLLFCFVSAFGRESVSEALDFGPHLLKENLIPLLCGIELESLNLMYSVQMFTSCSKSELIQRILSSNINNPRSVILCIRLCLEYNIWEAPIWEVILRRMVLKPMDYSLESILQSTQGYLKHLWHNEAFIAAWKCVILGILQMKCNEVSVLLSKLYKAIMSCPCTASLDTLFMTSELKIAMQTFGEGEIPELDSISDISSFIRNLKSMMNDFSQKVEN